MRGKQDLVEVYVYAEKFPGLRKIYLTSSRRRKIEPREGKHAVLFAACFGQCELDIKILVWLLFYSTLLQRDRRNDQLQIYIDVWNALSKFRL